MKPRIMTKRTSAVLFAALLATTACKKSEPAAGGGSGSAAAPGSAAAGGAQAPTGDTGGTPAAAGGGAMTKSQSDDLSLLPVKSEVVLGINFAQMQGGQLWKDNVAPQIAKNMEKLEEFKAKCGFDPLASIKSLTLGLSNLGEGKPTGAVVVRGLDKGKTTDCLVNKMKDEIAAKGGSVTQDGDYIVMKDKDGTTSTAKFIADDVLLMAAGGDKAQLDTYAKGDTALKSSPMFVDMFGKLKSTDTVWGLLRGDSKALEPLAGMGVKVKAIYGSVNVTDNVTASLRARVENPDQAATIVTMINGQVAKAKMFMDKVDVGTEGNDVKVDAMITAEKLKALQSLAGMGGGGGMGGPPPATDPAAPPAPATP